MNRTQRYAIATLICNGETPAGVQDRLTDLGFCPDDVAERVAFAERIAPLFKVRNGHVPPAVVEIVNNP